MITTNSPLEMLTPAEKAREIGVSKETLRRWRRDGTGPDWRKFGPNVVRYWPETDKTETTAM